MYSVKCIETKILNLGHHGKSHHLTISLNENLRQDEPHDVVLGLNLYK